MSARRPTVNATPAPRPPLPVRPKPSAGAGACITCGTPLDAEVLQLKPGVVLHRRCFVCFACSVPLSLGAYAELPSSAHPGHYLCPLHANRASAAGTRSLPGTRTQGHGLMPSAMPPERRGTAAPRLDATMMSLAETRQAPGDAPSQGPSDALALPHISPRRSMSLDTRQGEYVEARGRTATALSPRSGGTGPGPAAALSPRAQAAQALQMSGYLQRATGQAMRRWKRMYCVCVAGTLQMRASPEERATDEISLAATSVVREADVAGAKGPCFSLLTASRIHLLQADSEAELVRWLSVLRSGAGGGAAAASTEVRSEGYVRMQVPAAGFLFDTGGGKKGEATWAWRWLQVKDGYVYLYKFKEDKKLVDAIDLLLCAVSDARTDGREHTFELTLGKDESYVVQTESAAEQAEWLRALRYHISQLRKDVERQVASPKAAAGEAEKRGWLQKRGDGGVLRGWHRRWCVLRGEALYWHKAEGDAQAQGSASVLFAMPRETRGKDRRFLELVTAERTYEFQAATPDEGQAWLSLLRAVQQRLMNNKLRQTLSARRMSVMPALLEGHENGARARPDFRRLLDDVLARPGNAACADCGEPEPLWASINLGVFICVQCAGGHRSLGVHLSQVRSVTLDRWEPEAVEVMAERGNLLANSDWERNAALAAARRPQHADSLEVRERFIRDKYERRLFAAPEPAPP